MTYLYYPGCSLKGTGRAYEESALQVFKALNIQYQELDDWNCCGATAYMAISELQAFALSARNLAIAEKAMSGTVDIIAPCAACYLVLNKTVNYLRDFEDIGQKIHSALAAAGLKYEGRVRIRHPLDVLVNDIGIDKIAARVSKPLKEYKVASYYGCQIVRPYATFDDQHDPQTMDQIMKALGAEVIDWPLKTRCCGGSLTGTIQDVGGRLGFILLKEAKRRGANVISTACPLCQFNLECYQDSMKSAFNEDVSLASVYFTQLMGLAFGIDGKELGMGRIFVQPNLSAQGGSHVRS
jgi:heterodisulfide reductase subunit B2